eukprot:m.538934 g.538934  ORF g.538934 m.538934 type:complete len:1261 (-) comp57631_c0_seq1:136-3918(-)
MSAPFLHQKRASAISLRSQASSQLLLTPVLDELSWEADWYREKAHPDVILEALERLPDGHFLVRDDPRTDGAFLLSYQYQGQVQTVRIENVEERVKMEGSSRSFPQLWDLVEFYRSPRQDVLRCPLASTTSDSLPAISEAAVVDRNIEDTQARQLAAEGLYGRQTPQPGGPFTPPEPASPSAKPSPLQSPSSRTDSTPVGKWTVSQVSEWLVTVGMKQYCEAFEQNLIDGEALFLMTPSSLKELGVLAIGHRTKLFSFIEALRVDSQRASSKIPSHNYEEVKEQNSRHSVVELRPHGAPNPFEHARPLSFSPEPAVVQPKHFVGRFEAPASRSSIQRPVPSDFQTSVKSSPSRSSHTQTPSPTSQGSPFRQSRHSQWAHPASRRARPMSTPNFQGLERSGSRATVTFEDTHVRSSSPPTRLLPRTPSPVSQARSPSPASRTLKDRITNAFATSFKRKSKADSAKTAGLALDLRIDNAARQALFYLGPCTLTKAKAALQGCEDGSFVVLLADEGSGQRLYLVYRHDSVSLSHEIENHPKGLRLLGSKASFDTLSLLISKLRQKRLVLKTTLSVTSTGGREAVSSLAHSKQGLSPRQAIVRNEHLSTFWYFESLPHHVIDSTLEIEPLGSFIVTSCHEGPTCFELSFVSMNGITRKFIEINEHGYRLDQADLMFESLTSLIRYYGRHQAPDLPLLLREPDHAYLINSARPPARTPKQSFRTEFAEPRPSIALLHSRSPSSRTIEASRPLSMYTSSPVIESNYARKTVAVSRQPSFPAHPSPSRAISRAPSVPTSSWFFDQSSGVAMTEQLRDRPTGSFLVRPTDSFSSFILAYVIDGCIFQEVVQTTTTPTHSGVHLERFPHEMFRNLQELVEYYTTDSTSLGCLLRHRHQDHALAARSTHASHRTMGKKTDHPTLSDPHLLLQPNDSAKLSSTSTTPTTLTTTSFVEFENAASVVSESSSLSHDSSSASKLGVHPFRQPRQRRIFAQSAAHRASMLSEAPDPQLPFLPLTSSTMNRFMSHSSHSSSTFGKPSLTSKSKADWQWYQIGVPKQTALAHLAHQADGAFVVRTSETRADRYALSYVFMGKLCHEIICAPSGDLSRSGVHLEKAPHLSFGNLHELLAYFQSPRLELACSLRNPNAFKSPLLNTTPIAEAPPAQTQSTRNDFAARSAPWNCLGVPREQALDRLQGGRTGTFVVRDGANFFGMLTLVLDGKLHQVPIEETEQGLRLQKTVRQFACLSHLVAYYARHDQADLPASLVFA